MSCLNIDNRGYKKVAFNLSGLSHAAMALVAASLLVQTSRAATAYWDINGATAGAGGATPSGLWDAVTANWSSSSAGTVATTTWSSGDTAVFSAGADATGTYTITLSGTQIAGALTFEDGIASLGSGALTLNGTGLITVNASPTKAIIASAIGGSVGLTKASSGELVLQAANSFTGNLTNRAGTITFDNDLAASTGSIVVSPTSAAALHSSASLITLANNIQMLGATSTVEVNADSGATLALNGVISGPHPWTINGSGIVKLGGAGFNTFAGALVVAQGKLVAAKNQALGAAVNTASISSGATLAFEGGFEYNTAQGTKTVILNGPGVAGGAALDNVSGDNIFDGNVVLNADSSVGAAADSLTINGPITGLFNITKAGPGTVDLTGTGNTYNNTFVNQGTLGVFFPSIAGVGLVTVSSGATLEGNGNAPGGVALSGTISPGASPGTFNSGSETWNGGGSYHWEINDAAGSAGSNPGWDLVNITGGLSITATSGNKFTISVNSLDSSFDVPGDADNFNHALDYTWTIGTTTTGITGFDPTAFIIDDSNFSNPNIHGKFVLELANSSKDLVLKFIHPPFITSQPVSATKECGVEGVTFTVGADGTPTLSYQWKKNGFDIGGATTSSLTINPVFSSDAASYTVQINNGFGSTNSNPAVLTVQDTAMPVLTPCPANILVAGSGPTVVSFACPTATDVCDGTVPVTCTPPSGFAFPVGSTLVTASATDAHNNTATCTFYVTVCAPNQPVVYVDDNYVGKPDGAFVKFPDGGAGPDHVIGCDAFATIQGGVNAAGSGGTVNVAAGTYAEAILINKSLALLGAQAGQEVNARFSAFTSGANGPKADPAVESIITAAATDPSSGANDTVHVMADNVTVNGFVIDGNNPALAQGGATVVGGINTDSRRAIQTENATGTPFAASNTTVRNNIIQNYSQRGVELINGSSSGSAPATDGSLITLNLVRNFGLDGIVLAFNAYATVTFNTVVTPDFPTEAGIWVQDYLNTGSPHPMTISSNNVTVGQDNFGGIWVNLAYMPALTINGNTINAAAGVTGASDFTFGIYLSSLRPGSSAGLSGNTVGASGGQFARGIALWNLGSSATTTTLTGGTVGNSVDGVSLHVLDPNFGLPGGADSAADLSGMSVSGTTIGVLVDATGSTGAKAAMQISGNTSVSGCTTGVSVVGAQASANVHDNLASITGNAVGVEANGSKVKLQSNTLTGNTQAGIQVSNGATVDAGDCTGSNSTGMGSSTGGNILSGYGFDDAAPWAIENLNASAEPVVLAHNNTFGAGSLGADIRLVLYDVKDNAAKSVVRASDTVAAITCPPSPASVQCVSGIQAAATTIDGFYALGGAASTTEGSVGHLDSASVPGPNDGVVSRTYTVGDACGQSVNCVQSLPVDDTTAPSVACQPTTKTLNVGDSTVVVSPGDVFASGTDNCGGTVTPVSVTPNTFCYAGVYSVTLTGTDGNGNDGTCVASVTVIDNRPTPTVVYVDDGYVGLPDCTLVNWPYTGAGSLIIGYNAFATVQGGINKVASAGTVNVAAGNYSENIVLNKRVNLNGAQTGIDARGRVTGAPNPAVESIITPAVAGTTILELQGPACAQSVINGFAFSGGTALAVIRSTVGDTDYLQILNNHVDGFTGEAIFLDKNGIDITIAQNVLDGSSKTSAGGTLHLDTDTFQGVQIIGNWIQNAPFGSGMFVDGNRNVKPSANRQPLIVQNLFANHASNVGINMGSRSFDSGTIALNTFTNNASDGLQGGPKDSLIISNLFIDNGRWGLALTSFGNTGVGRGAINDSITCNTFTRNGFGPSGGGTNCGGILFSAAQPAGNNASLRVNFNNISLNSTGAVYTGTETVNATNNWWGAASGPTIASNPGGTGDQIMGTTINYNPFLTSDNSFPAILCPSTIVVGNDAGQCSAVVNFTVTATSGCCGGPIDVGSTPPSGSTFPVGTNTVVSMATNACGNVSTCSFLVVVQDTEAPVIGAVTATEIQPSGTVNVKNCANVTIQGTVNISVGVTDQCPLVPPTINLTNGANTAVAAFVNQSPPGVFNYTFVVGPTTPGGTWTATVRASDANTSSTSTFTLCVNPDQITGQIQLEGFVGTGTVPLHTRTVVFVATDGPGGGANVLKTWTIALSNVSGDTFNYVLTDVPPATQGLSAKTAWTKRSKLPVTLDINGQANVNLTGADQLLGGDLQGDNIVNFFDYSILGNNFFTFNAVADITGDGQVALDDYFVLSSNWFTTGDPQ